MKEGGTIMKTWRSHVRVKSGRHWLKWYQRERKPHRQGCLHPIFLLHKCIKGYKSKRPDVCGFLKPGLYRRIVKAEKRVEREERDTKRRKWSEKRRYKKGEEGGCC